MMPVIRTSIRLRLLVWIGLLAAVMLAGLVTAAYELTRRTQLAQIDAGLARRLGYVVQDVVPGPRQRGRPGPGQLRDDPEDGARGPGGPGSGDHPPARDRPPGGPGAGPPPARVGFRDSGEGRPRVTFSAETLAEFRTPAGPTPFFVVWSPTGAPLGQSENAPANVKPPRREGLEAGIQFATSGDYRLASFWTELGDCVVVGSSLEPLQAELRRFLGWLLAASALVLFVGVGGGWWIITRALRPVGQIATTARRIADGDLAERIRSSDAESELGRLAAVLNSTFDRLEHAFAEQRQFTADASHELRTPLAVIIAEAQAALARPRTGAEYQETLEACLEAAQDLRRLADSLLNLARLDSAAPGAGQSSLDLAELAGDAVQRMQPLAEARGLRLNTDLQPAAGRADASQLRQVLVNLLDNAIYYSADGRTVTVRTWRSEHEAFLAVQDEGCGISPEHLPHIFKRFYRAEAARTGGERRAGLGLAIVQAIVTKHGGRISVVSEVGQGTTFTVQLPA